MSVSLTPINDPEGESVDMSNGTWHELTRLAAPAVKRWNDLHDPIVYTPEELRAIAAVVPKEWSGFGWTEALEYLAQAGGAELS